MYNSFVPQSTKWGMWVALSPWHRLEWKTVSIGRHTHHGTYHQPWCILYTRSPAWKLYVLFYNVWKADTAFMRVLKTNEISPPMGTKLSMGLLCTAHWVALRATNLWVIVQEGSVSVSSSLDKWNGIFTMIHSHRSKEYLVSHVLLSEESCFSSRNSTGSISAACWTFKICKLHNVILY